MIKGIDISNNDGDIDFADVSASGVSLVIIKATEGKTYKDSYKDTYYKGATSNNMFVGFYHFLVGTSSPEDQAIAFWDSIKGYSFHILPVLDVERSFSQLNDYIIRFVAKFKEISGYDMILYTYTSFLENLNYASCEVFPFCWEANYNDIATLESLPQHSKLANTAVIGHQYTENGKVSGINCDVDINVFSESILGSIKGYVVTNYIKDGFEENGAFKGVDIDYVRRYMVDRNSNPVRIYARSDSNGIWFESQMLPIEDCVYMQKVLGSWFYGIRTTY